METKTVASATTCACSIEIRHTPVMTRWAAAGELAQHAGGVLGVEGLAEDFPG